MQISRPLELASRGYENGAVTQLRVLLFEALSTNRCSPRLAFGQNDLLSFNPASVCERHPITAYPAGFTGVGGRGARGQKVKAMAVDLGIEVEGLLVDQSRPTTSKTRIVAGSQQLARVDRECDDPISEMLEHCIVLEIERCAKSADAFILADYAKGVLSHSVCHAVIRAAAGKPVIVDPKGLNWRRYRRATVIKPNTKEAETITGRLIITHEDSAHVPQTISTDLH